MTEDGTIDCIDPRTLMMQQVSCPQYIKPSEAKDSELRQSLRGTTTPTPVFKFVPSPSTRRIKSWKRCEMNKDDISPRAIVSSQEKVETKRSIIPSGGFCQIENTTDRPIKRHRVLQCPQDIKTMPNPDKVQPVSLDLSNSECEPPLICSDENTTESFFIPELSGHIAFSELLYATNAEHPNQVIHNTNQTDFHAITQTASHNTVDPCSFLANAASLMNAINEGRRQLDCHRDMLEAEKIYVSQYRRDIEQLGKQINYNKSQIVFIEKEKQRLAQQDDDIRFQRKSIELEQSRIYESTSALHRLEYKTNQERQKLQDDKNIFRKEREFTMKQHTITHSKVINHSVIVTVNKKNYIFHPPESTATNAAVAPQPLNILCPARLTRIVANLFQSLLKNASMKFVEGSEQFN